MSDNAVLGKLTNAARENNGVAVSVVKTEHGTCITVVKGENFQTMALNPDTAEMLIDCLNATERDS